MIINHSRYLDTSNFSKNFSDFDSISFYSVSFDHCHDIPWILCSTVPRVLVFVLLCCTELYLDECHIKEKCFASSPTLRAAHDTPNSYFKTGQMTGKAM